MNLRLKTGSIISKITYFYHATLPFLGFIAIFQLNEDSGATTSLILFGWIVLLLYQIIKLGLLSKQFTRKTFLFLPLIPISLLSLNTYFSSADLWYYFLEQSVLEIVTLMLALCIVFLFIKDHKGRTAWQDLGIIPLLVCAFIVLGSWGFIQVWLDKSIYLNNASFSLKELSFILAFFISIWINLKILIQLVKRKITIPDVFEENMKISTFLIIGQIIVWMLIIPLIFKLII